ncbi:aromatic acid exporter family protein [Clostridium sp. Marseille-P2415]|uniref:aromatic acid exporter family protein n=1 Tax=Clostridium sp. Marseille-P2415 TaxID=1805471 RepID=UPI00098869F0|nr:aromatic acid exporter family protein [Clostridium sp. Marseille-P2415]
MDKEKVIKSIKIALAAVFAITAAAEIGLKYSATAGIITVLSIQNTKRETIKSARNRTLAFVWALILAAGVFRLLGFTLIAFAGYLLLFALLCLYADWGEAIAMDSVLITHFLSEKSMSASLMMNEIALFLIGTTVGVLVNMHLRKRGNVFQKLADDVDHQIKGVLNRMSHWLLEEDKSKYGPECLDQLQESLKLAKACAWNNYNNALWKKDTYEVDYIQMRQQQSIVLKEIYENIKSITCLPRQAKQVAELLEGIERGYHRNNTVEGLLQELDLLFQDLKGHELPSDREEFEARAILFYILNQIKRLLMLKRDFVLSHS